MANHCFYIHLLIIVFQVSEGWLGPVGDFVDDTVDKTGDFVEDAVDQTVDVVRTVVDETVDLGEDIVDVGRDIITDIINKGLDVEVESIPYILENVAKIPDIISDLVPITEIKSAVDFVKENDDIILDNVNLVKDGFECAVSLLDPSNLINLIQPPQDEAVDTMQILLNTCIDDLKTMADADVLSTISTAIQSRNVPECFDDLFDLLDALGGMEIADIIPDRVTRALAEVLVHTSREVDLFCTMVVPQARDIVIAIKGLITQISTTLSLSQETPPTTDDKCNADESGLCTAAEVRWYIANDEGVYHLFIESLRELMYPNGISSASDANKLANWRTAIMILDPIENIESVCATIAEVGERVDVWYGVKVSAVVDFMAMLVCKSVNVLFQIGITTIKSLVEFADFHDGMIMVAQNDALLQNTQNIIRNQQTLMSSLQQHQQNQVLSVPVYPLKGNWNDDYTFVIDNGSRNLHIIGISVIGFIVVFIVLAVMVIVECFYGEDMSGTHIYKSVQYMDSEFEFDNILT